MSSLLNILLLLVAVVVVVAGPGTVWLVPTGRRTVTVVPFCSTVSICRSPSWLFTMP